MKQRIHKDEEDAEDKEDKKKIGILFILFILVRFSLCLCVSVVKVFS
jgi:hypothetical protein